MIIKRIIITSTVTTYTISDTQCLYILCSVVFFGGGEKVSHKIMNTLNSTTYNTVHLFVLGSILQSLWGGGGARCLIK